ncbi:homoprotocatechuate degradation operon regulator HpaR [Massilia niastensis]|uniref:homoprotocatechuate degradation operon regulator HpaR n=1 Tax=Massilia niastensis TaxID=544911 RepID=UPI00037572F6|nr:homoprotocatechuate degradation operon regulator HpaR [Massilia niastensis]
MPRRITHRNLPQLFLKARDSLMSHFRPILNHFGVTEQQWRVLRALDEHEQLEPREICDLCQILSPSMAGVLARMEEMELVARKRVAADGRRVMVSLAPKGDRLIDEIAPLIEQQYRLIEQACGKRLLDDLSSALAGFIDAQATPVARVELPAIAPVSAGRRTPPG